MTIERIIPETMDPQDRSLREHRERYTLAASLLRPTDHVIDAGCGAGYGSAILADKAKSVLGLDLAEDAIDYAKSHYTKDNVSFQLTDLETAKLTLCDVLVAFEFIEHIEDAAGFVDRAKRAANRLMVISTPVTPTMHRNEFHLHDWTQDEVESMFHPWVTSYRLLQAGSDREVYGVWAFAPEAAAEEVRKQTLEGNLRDQQVELMRGHTLLFELLEWTTELQRGKDWLEGQVQSLRTEVELRDSQIAELKSWIEELEREKAWLESQLGLGQSAEHGATEG